MILRKPKARLNLFVAAKKPTALLTTRTEAEVNALEEEVVQAEADAEAEADA